MSKRVKQATLQRMSDWELHANAGWRKGEWMAIEDSVCEKLA